MSLWCRFEISSDMSMILSDLITVSNWKFLKFVHVLYKIDIGKKCLRAVIAMSLGYLVKLWSDIASNCKFLSILRSIHILNKMYIENEKKNDKGYHCDVTMISGEIVKRYIKSVKVIRH